MFLKFSPQLPQLMPLLASASAYFAIDCARKFFRPGLRAQSFHDFFYKTGRVSLLSTYSRILLQLPLSCCSQQTGRWVLKTSTTPQQATVKCLWGFTPSKAEAAEGYIAVGANCTVEVQRSSRSAQKRTQLGALDEVRGLCEDLLFTSLSVVQECTSVVVCSTGQRGKIPSSCIAGSGEWLIEYHADDAPSTASSFGGCIDSCSALAMRTCSSGLLAALILRLGYSSCSLPCHWKLHLRATRFVLSRVAQQRSRCIIKVCTACKSNREISN
jgi:hypothetical protein